MTLHMTPLGYTSRPPVMLPPVDRAALMRAAHRIAKSMRRLMASYPDALAYGLRAAWAQVKVARTFRSLNAQVRRREHTATEIANSRAATHRCGSSYRGA
jgi:hypothetical protein